MIRLNLSATGRETKRIILAASQKKMSIGQFVRFALGQILGHSKAGQRKPPSSERHISQKKSRRTGL